MGFFRSRELRTTDDDRDIDLTSWFLVSVVRYHNSASARFVIVFYANYGGYWYIAEYNILTNTKQILYRNLNNSPHDLFCRWPYRGVAFLALFPPIFLRIMFRLFYEIIFQKFQKFSFTEQIFQIKKE